MPNELQITGLTELQQQLATLPAELQSQAAPILAAAAQRAVDEVKAAYPMITGALKAGVTVIARVPRGVAALFTVRSAAPYAHIYEFGGARQRPRATFLPITGRDRRAATAAVVGLVTAAGLTVGGKTSD